jgi:hypothetical protein
VPQFKHFSYGATPFSCIFSVDCSSIFVDIAIIFAAKLLKIIYLSILFCIQIGLHLPFLYIKEPNVGQNVALLYFKVSGKRYTFAKVKKNKKEKQA